MAREKLADKKKRGQAREGKQQGGGMAPLEASGKEGDWVKKKKNDVQL